MSDATVVVPSFGRLDYLRRCLAALRVQDEPPAEVVVVTRTGDAATQSVAAESGARTAYVRVPGHLPPLVAGIHAATADVVAFVDDDAEPWPGWLAALLRHYRDAGVGGAGGLVVQPGPGERAVAASIGVVRRGRFDALATERIPSRWGARTVDALRGTNMSFRRELLLSYPWDDRLNRGAATDYEVDLCAWVRRRGYRLVYDPDAVVTHHLAARPAIGRAATPERIADYSHNLVYVSGKALPPGRGALAIAQAFLVGSRASYGVLTTLGDTMLGRPPALRAQVLPAFAGKVAGLASLWEYRRRGPRPLALGDGPPTE